MNRPRALSAILLVLAIALVFVCNARAQNVPPLDKIQNQAELERAVTALDAALFDAYNSTTATSTSSHLSWTKTSSSTTIKAELRSAERP
jgi:hypothetical protein